MSKHLHWLASCLALAFAADASAQCNKSGGKQQGPGQGTQRMNTMRQQPGLRAQPPTPTFVQQQPPMDRQLLALQQPQLTPLQVARQRLVRMAELVATLQDVQDDPRLTEARQKRLQTTLTAAIQKMEQQDEALTALERQAVNGFGEAQLVRLSAVLTQQAAMIVALQAHQQSAEQAMQLRQLQAVQKK